MDKIYLVKYCGGSHDNYYSVVVFATTKKSTATKYVRKFNRILNKWDKYYSRFESNELGWSWIKKEYVEQHFNRWNSLKNVTRCYYEEIEVR